MWWDIAGEERWQGQFTPIKCIWVKVGIRKIQWSPTNDDRPWTSTTHMASLTSQRGAQCRINGKTGLKSSSTFRLFFCPNVPDVYWSLRCFFFEGLPLWWEKSERFEASLQLHVTILAPESAPAVLHQPIVLAPLAAIAHHQDAMVQGGSTNPRWFRRAVVWDILKATIARKAHVFQSTLRTEQGWFSTDLHWTNICLQDVGVGVIL